MIQEFKKKPIKDEKFIALLVKKKPFFITILVIMREKVLRLLTGFLEIFFSCNSISVWSGKVSTWIEFLIGCSYFIATGRFVCWKIARHFDEFEPLSVKLIE